MKKTTKKTPSKGLGDTVEKITKAKGKAKEFFDKIANEICQTDAKICALIAVNEIINSTFSKKWYDNNNIIPADYLLTEYWQEVKQEIEKI